MQPITSAENLKEAISMLERKQAIQIQSLKDGFHDEYEKMKPVNFMKGIIHDITSMPEIKDNLVGTGAGLVAGVIAKKLIIGSSFNPLTRIAGNMAEVAVTTYAAKHSHAIKSAVLSLFTYLIKPRTKKVVYQLGEY